jgi:hypothetical protein
MNTARNERARSSYLRVLVSIQKWIGERRATRAYLCRSVHSPFGPRGSTVSGRRTYLSVLKPRPVKIVTEFASDFISPALL